MADETPQGRSDKSPGAFRTIGEVAREVGVPQHVLRYWEEKFARLEPSRSSGNRRIYRPQDVELVRQIRSLLHDRGYTTEAAVRLLDTSPAEATTASRLECVIAELEAVRTLLAGRK